MVTLFNCSSIVALVNHKLPWILIVNYLCDLVVDMYPGFYLFLISS